VTFGFLTRVLTGSYEGNLTFKTRVMKRLFSLLLFLVGLIGTVLMIVRCFKLNDITDLQMIGYFVLVCVCLALTGCGLGYLTDQCLKGGKI
jgi:hypothetical protein